MTDLEKILQICKEDAHNTRDKGTRFEKLSLDFLTHDRQFSPQFSQVQTYAQWAKSRDQDQRDTGIDLVATNVQGDGFTAIQCKFHIGQNIPKGEIDSFVGASSDYDIFTRRILIDTTSKGLTNHSEQQLDNPKIAFTRIGLNALENSSIDWGKYLSGQLENKEKKSLREHQEQALESVMAGFKTADRGKMLMACGTGKTFTSLKIAERYAGASKRVLFLVPSLSLMQQSIREWTQETSTPLYSFAVCSDAKVGQKRVNREDAFSLNPSDLSLPATTNAKRLAQKATIPQPEKMLVIFSTYQSLPVINTAQKQYGLPKFDLIICDEAHRTTGAHYEGEEASNFVQIHNNDFVQGEKRLYMTATPRIYGDAAQDQAREKSANLFSMDDENHYGKVFYTLKFSQAVDKGLLSDYKIMILAVDPNEVAAAFQERLSDPHNTLTLDVLSKFVGCYRALTKQDSKTKNKIPMHRVLTFCSNIDNSEKFAEQFYPAIKDQYLKHISQKDFQEVQEPLECQVQHIDGTDDANTRTERLDWLKEDMPENTCHILSNARCLSEGVDVPALDAIIFMHPRKSKVDVVQSVGRVMRKAPGKDYGYVILPVAVPDGLDEYTTLEKHPQFKVIMEVLNALRSHDDRLDNTLHRFSLGEEDDDKIEIIHKVNFLNDAQTSTRKNPGPDPGISDEEKKKRDGDSKPQDKEEQKQFRFDVVVDAIRSQIIKKEGSRIYWKDWSENIANIAQNYSKRLEVAIAQEPAAKVFQQFIKELQDQINPGISAEDALEILVQNGVTKPVFQALFSNEHFTKDNPLFRALNKVEETLMDENLHKELQTLDPFFQSVQERVANLKKDQSKQKLIYELYENFFAKALPKESERMGIVYTPIEVVDFMLNSANDLLQAEFGRGLNDKGVHIIDPFVGTGTFISQLLKKGYIDPDNLEWKYKNEIHANEIVLLAYYIAAVNIETTYHSLRDGPYEHFPGICFADTFTLGSGADKSLLSPLFQENNERIQRQEATPLQLIIGNPPYSKGQRNENDNNKNRGYPALDERIKETYVAQSKATLKNSLYDSYIRAFRWASDRIGEQGLIAFVSNGGYLDSSSADGLRQCLAQEFSSLHIVHLRGNGRTSGETCRKEGGQIFNAPSGKGGSLAPIVLNFFLKNPHKSQKGDIFFYDIGDSLSRIKKLDKLRALQSLSQIPQKDWQKIYPDQHNDWFAQRDDSFEQYKALGSKEAKKNKAQADALFKNYSGGIKTNRDAWVYQFSKELLEKNMQECIHFYTSELQRYQSASPEQKKNMDQFVHPDPKKISWSRAIKKDLKQEKASTYSEKNIVRSLYRPYTQHYLYYSRQWNEVVSQMPKIFPEPGLSNRVIALSGTGARDFSCLMSQEILDLNMMKAGAQCFPLYLYESQDSAEEQAAKEELWAKESPEHLVPAESGNLYSRSSGLSDEGLKYFREFYQEPSISEENIFYYIYALLQHPEYREKYGHNLTKQLPRILRVKSLPDFWSFVHIGQQLGDLHCRFDEAPVYPVSFNVDLNSLEEADFYVKKMKFLKKGKETDKSVIRYNEKISVENIPLDAYAYVVSNKSAIEWVMDRQGVSTHKESGIVNDANLWATQTMHNPRYPLELLQKVISISLETQDLIKKLPPL